MNQLIWEKLLCGNRPRKTSSIVQTKENKGTSFVARNEFEADYDRIVGSSSVRRLQDKAQVFPLQENDFTRTRLTHSMEVSALARSLGKAVGKQLEKREDIQFSAEMTDELAAMLQTAGLIHDLGNPPFGHYGETVIRQWFFRWFNSNELLENAVLLTQQEKNDFINFDGNVQNLRIVTKLQTLNDAYGANFTFGTLATIIKYPWPSDSKEKSKHKDKFGYFKSEENIYKTIIENTGLAENQRHPATYLLEAADDIIYTCDDIEDGVKKGYIEWDEVYPEMKKKFSDELHKNIFDAIDKKIIDITDKDDIKFARVRNFRNYVQSYLFSKAVQEFMDNYEHIMDGTYGSKELLGCEQAFVDYLKKEITGKYCFSCHEVIALELVGDRVIRTLLDIFITAVVVNESDDLEKTATYAGKIYSLISSNFKYIALYNYEDNSKKTLKELSIYDKIHLVVDFVSGMTDSYAVNLYKELTGISIPYINN